MFDEESEQNATCMTEVQQVSCLFASSFYVFLFSVISKIEIYYSSHRKYCKKYGKCQGNIHLPNKMCFSIWGSSSQLHMAGTLSSRIWVRRSLWDLKVWLSSRKTRWAKLHTMDHENMDFKEPSVRRWRHSKVVHSRCRSATPTT